MFRTIAIVLATPLLLAANPVAAENVIIVPHNLVQGWVDEVSTSLNERLAKTPVRFRDTINNDFVQMQFERAPDGKPTAVRMVRRSSNPWLNRAARRAVETMELQPLPTEIDQGQLLQANFITATSERAYRDLSRRLEREEQVRLATATTGRPVLSLTVLARP